MLFRIISLVGLLTVVGHAQTNRVRLNPHPLAGPIASVGPELATQFNFEERHDSLVPAGWQVQGAGVGLDRFGARNGKWAVRLDASRDFPGRPISLFRILQVECEGQFIEFRAMLRTEGTGNYATLRMDLFNAQQQELARYVMLGGPQRETQPWKEGIVRIPFKPGTAFVRIFVFSSGGTTWVDDLRLLVDGKPIWEAPRKTAASGPRP